MNLIGFSHHYTKLHEQTHGILIYVDSIMLISADIGSEWWRYDTEYRATSCTYQHYDKFVPNREYVRLVFLGNKGIPFTTYREYKKEYIPKNPHSLYWHNNSPHSIRIPYSDLIGEEFIFKFRGEAIPDYLKPEDKKYDVIIYD